MQLDAFPQPAQQDQRVDGRLTTSSASPPEVVGMSRNILSDTAPEKTRERVVSESRRLRKRHKGFRNDGGVSSSSNAAGPGCFRDFGAERTRSAELENEM